MKITPETCSACQTPLDDLGLCPRCLIAKMMAPTSTGQGESSAPALDEVAAAFPDLDVLELIGKGGMGAVYKCRQKSLDRFVALKLLPQTLAADQSFARRFQAEAKALAALNHPNIVTIHEFGNQGGFYFLLMEFVDGLNLRHLIRDRKLSPEEALAIIPPLCEALQYAHERHIVHRDIKPENLLLDTEGRIKVADFGIAKIINQTDLQPEHPAGTPAYMAPEQQHTPASVDARADIYSLGVVLYEMLTGERPGNELTPPSQKAQLDIRLDEVVLRALSEKPDQRWQSATDLNTQIQSILTEPATAKESPVPNPTGPKKRILIAFATLCTLFLLWQYHLFNRDLPARQLPIFVQSTTDADLAFLEEKLTPLYLRQATALASGLGARHPEVFSISAQIAAYEKGFPDLDPAKLLNRKRIVFFHLILEQENIIASRSAEGLGALHPEVLKAQRVIAELEKLRNELP